MRDLSSFNRTFRFVGLASLVVGLVGIAFGAFGVYRTAQLVRQGQTAEARIVRLESSRRNSGSSTFPVFAFTDRTGQRREARSPSSVSTRHLQKGQRVEIIYIPEAPTVARIDNFGQLWGGPVILPSGVGLGFLLASMATLVLLPRLLEKSNLRKPEA